MSLAKALQENSSLTALDLSMCSTLDKNEAENAGAIIGRALRQNTNLLYIKLYPNAFGHSLYSFLDPKATPLVLGFKSSLSDNEEGDPFKFFE